MSQVDPNVPGQPAKKSGCMGCSWWVVIPTGCLTLCLLGCGGAFLMGFGIFKAAAGLVTQSQGYIKAVSHATNNPKVREALGEPITVGTPSNPNYSNNNGQVHISFSVELTGPKGKGTLNVVADGSGSDFKFSTAEVSLPNGSVDLLKDEDEKDK